MGDIDWTSALVVLGGGLALGGGLVALSRKGGKTRATADVGREARLEDLRRRREVLVEQLRDLEDTGSAGEAVADAERARLEREAATVLRELARLESDEGAAPVAPPPVQTGGMSPQLRGALQGGLVVGFIALLFFVLQNQTRPRQEGMGITGNDPRPMSGAMARGGAGGGGGMPADHPAPAGQETERLAAARAAAEANPQDLDAKVELAFALAEAEQWMEAYKLSDEILKIEPGQPDALMVQSSIRLVMGQLDRAIELADQVLQAHPKHAKALAYRGMLAFRAGDREASIAFLERAREVVGPDETLDTMLKEVRERPLPTEAGADGGEMPPGHPQVPGAAPGEAMAGAMPPGHPPMAGAAAGGAMPGGAMPPGHPPMGAAGAAPADDAGGDVAIAGTVRLADGVSAPAGATLFVIARNPGVQRGPPAATRRYSAASLPLSFALGQGNVMLGGPFPDEVTLSARLDVDGNAMTHSPQDLEATAGTVKKGTSGIELVLRPKP
ncbi:MAG: hypothetical protein H6744_02110 [Deltaproteobacteria bacterium]|nr:hypothetical protein [Deltaproteobacteria bacterium]